MEDIVRRKLEEAGVDVKTVLERFLGNEKLLLPFLEKFSKDPNYNRLILAMEKKDYEEAFNAAHTIKGICGNLSIDGLYEIMSREVEFLRNKKYSEAEAMLPELMKEYERIIAILDTI